MQDIRNDSESIRVSPFQEEIVLENYFDGANRGEVLAHMHEAIKNGAALLVLTGEEGSGKTMLCRLFEQEVLPRGLGKTVFFPKTVDSFDDVVRSIMSELGLDAASGMDSGSAEEAVETISALLLSESVELLVIFDEAENMFLATLERIRKMFDRINGSGARMHILFSGRTTFLENCDQLSLCDFQKKNEKHFPLTPLSESETADYLENCAARLPDTDATKVFTDEIVGNIYSLAQGNFRMTNMLGEESVKIHGDDTSFMVLLEGVKDGGDSAKQRQDEGKYSQLMHSAAAYLPWIGGAAGCLLLLLYLFGPGNDASDPGSDIVDKRPQTVQIEMPAAVQEAKVHVDSPDEEESVTVETESVSVETVVPAVTIPLVSVAVEHVESAPLNEEAGRKVAEVEEIKTPQPPAAEKNQDIAQLHSAGDVEKKAELSPILPQQVIKRESQTKIHKVIPAIAHSPAAKLYAERVAAGSAWTRKNKQDLYTVQIMLLASTTAEANLQKMLTQDIYRQEAGNFYIFRKKNPPENIFIFYGEYPTLERARLVKNSLPEFLRENKPYALSIKGAMAKVGK